MIPYWVNIPHAVNTFVLNMTENKSIAKNVALPIQKNEP